MKIKKIQKNKAYYVKLEQCRGFVILFAMVISSIILAIAIGVSNISFNELKFTTSARDTNDAFFAADTGAECVLFNDKAGQSFFRGDSVTVSCVGLDITPITINESHWRLHVVNLGVLGQSCALVNISINIVTDITTIVSNGYSKDNNLEDSLCVPAINSVERSLEVTY